MRSRRKIHHESGGEHEDARPDGNILATTVTVTSDACKIGFRGTDSTEGLPSRIGREGIEHLYERVS